MRKFFFLLLLVPFMFPQQVSAHAAGLQPFFKVNGVLPDMHPLQQENISPATFLTPQDLSKETYLVNQPIQFAIDTVALGQVYPDDTLKKITYVWDFGDGAKATGLINAHTYNKSGSFLVEIYADFQEAGIEPQLIESVQLNIVPYKAYQLSHVALSVNGMIADKKTIAANLQEPVRLSASVGGQSTEGLSYQWDFGDGEKSTEREVNHQYDTKSYLVTPVLRVTDKNGLIVDSFGILNNAKNSKGYTLTTDMWGVGILVVEGLVVLSGGAIFFILMLNKRSKKKKS